MKNSIFLVIISIAIGASISWLIKPDTQQTPEANQFSIAPPSEKSRKSSTRENTSSGPTKKPQNRVSTRIYTPNMQSPEMNEQIQTQLEKLKEQQIKNQQTKFEARLAKLAKKLNLTPVQLEAVRQAWLEKSDHLDEGPKAFLGMQKRNAMLTGNGLDETLDGILDGEQKDLYDELKAQEFSNKVESIALKNYSKLSYLSLRPEQKDAVMEILYDQAEAKAAKTSATDNAISTFTDGLGIDIDTSAMGLDSILESARSGEAITQDPQELMKLMQANAQMRIDQQVEALTPVLDEDQLSEYRTTLESRNQNPFGSIMVRPSIQTQPTPSETK